MSFKRMVLGALFALTFGAARADILFQTNGIPDHPSGSVSIFSGNYSSLGNPQWLGARFLLDAPAHVDGIGADFDYVEGTIFGAIIRLSDPHALPDGDPFSPGTVVAEITIGGGDPLYAIDADLEAGAYGLVFGSGYFGTQGFSGIFSGPGSGVNPPDTFFAYANSGGRPGGPYWFQAGFDGTQFTVTGTGGHAVPIPVPEPGAWALFIIGLTTVGAALRRRQRPRLHPAY